MTISTASIREQRPEGALRGALQPDGTVIWYMPGDTLPPDPPQEAPGLVVPQQVPARLALRLLLKRGWFGPGVTTPDQLNAAVEGFLVQALPTADARNAAILDWRRSAVFQFANPLIRAMLQPLGKTLDDLATLMIEAGEIEAAELAAQQGA